MAALHKEVAALRAALTARTSASMQIIAGLREEVYALLAALVSPDSSPPLDRLHPNEAQVQCYVPSKAPDPPTAPVQRSIIFCRLQSPARPPPPFQGLL